MATPSTTQVVLVLGGTGALGSAVSRAFAQAGAQVLVSYRSVAELQSVRAGLAAAQAARLTGQTLDATDASQMSALITQIEREHGRLDALVNAIGAYHGGQKLWELGDGVLDQMLDLNLRTGFNAARAALPLLLRQGRGSVVNVAAKSGVEPPPMASAYAASKAAALALMRSLALEVAGSGVRVNSVLPNVIDTLANRREMPQADFASWSKPDDIAQVIMFLCSDAARVINGAAIDV